MDIRTHVRFLREMRLSNQDIEAALASGAGAALTDADLVAVIVGCTHTEAERLLGLAGGLRGLVNQSDLAALGRGEGITGSGAARLAAAVEVGRRAAQAVPAERAIIRTADDAARLMAEMADLPQEHVRALLLDAAGGLMATVTLYIGTAYTAALRPAEVYRAALLRGASALLLVHNHPGGSPTPSPEDFETTRALASAGRLLGIPLIDHVIIGARGWVSLKELGFDL
jgi:DNA repair protein RadC